MNYPTPETRWNLPRRWTGRRRRRRAMLVDTRCVRLGVKEELNSVNRRHDQFHTTRMR